ncbi:MAG: hypothetical protein ACLQJR_24330, partial [Stellaceae bacterium]
MLRKRWRRCPTSAARSRGAFALAAQALAPLPDERCALAGGFRACYASAGAAADERCALAAK